VKRSHWFNDELRLRRDFLRDDRAWNAMVAAEDSIVPHRPTTEAITTLPIGKVQQATIPRLSHCDPV
jgi:hypothetical protein